MSGNTHSVSQEGLSTRLRRHESQCSVCTHPQRQEIEEAWLDWANTSGLAERFRLSRYSVYRHMHILGLYRERQNRIKRLYEKILERGEITSFSGSDILKALRDYTALCEREEAKQAASLPAQELLDPMSGQQAEVPAADRSAPEESAPQPASEGGTVPVAEGNQQCEPAVTPLSSPDVQNLEPTAVSTVQ